jgi:alpha-ketoglutarate-dependent taurine dioxygenase
MSARYPTSARTLSPDECTRGERVPAFPLVYEPAGEGSGPELVEFAREMQTELRDSLRSAGALLFRGFSVSGADQFAAVLEALGLTLHASYLGGTSPRRAIGKRAFSSTEAPPQLIIPAHNEMSYQSYRPRFVGFYCDLEPERYGETPLFDCRSALKRIPPELARALETEKISYDRSLPSEESNLFGGILRTWQSVFLTNDRAELEAKCDALGLTYWWRGTTLHTNAVVHPTPTHPETGERCLNVQLFHLSAMLQDMRELRPRYGPIEYLVVLFKICMAFALRLIPIRVRWGSGRRLAAKEASALRHAVCHDSVAFRWRRGDVLVVDNFSVAHGRLNVAGPRRIVAALANMTVVTADGACSTTAAIAPADARSVPSHAPSSRLLQAT